MVDSKQNGEDKEMAVYLEFPEEAINSRSHSSDTEPGFFDRITEFFRRMMSCLALPLSRIIPGLSKSIISAQTV